MGVTPGSMQGNKAVVKNSDSDSDVSVEIFVDADSLQDSFF